MKLVHVVDGVSWWGAVPQGVDVSQHGADGWDAIQCVEGIAAVRAVEEQRVGVDVFDGAGEGDSPEAFTWVSPPLEDRGLADMYPVSAAIVYVVRVAVVDGDISCVGEFAGA